MLKENFSKILIISSIFIGLTFSLGARAITAGGIGISPAYPDPENPLTRAWFIYNLEPGESKEDTVMVSNFGDQETTIIIYAVDSKLSNDGSFALAMPAEEKKDVGAWVKFLKEESVDEEEKVEEVEVIEIILGPKEEREVEFIITIPENADVGEHSGGIVIQEKPAEEKGGGGVAIVTRLGARIYQTVPGEIIQKLVLTEFEVLAQAEKYIINFSLKNEGNVSLTPEVKLSINDLFFHRIDQDLESKFQVSRGAEISRSFEWSKPKLYKFTYPGKFSLQAEINYDGQVIKSDSVTVLIISWLETSIFGGIILLLVIFLLIRRSSRKKEKMKMKEYQVKTGETIETVAAKFGLNWKKLAKINKLKPPYTLKAGQKIFILAK